MHLIHKNTKDYSHYIQKTTDYRDTIIAGHASAWTVACHDGNLQLSASMSKLAWVLSSRKQVIQIIAQGDMPIKGA